MVTLRNPTAEVFLNQLTQTVASIHREVAASAAAKERIKPDAGIFYWRGKSGNSARKVNSLASIPDSAIGKPPAAIGYQGRKGQNLAAKIAVEAARMFAASAPVRSGTYKGSLRVELNGKGISLSALTVIDQANPLSQSEVVRLIVMTDYASTLEADFAKYRMERGLARIASKLLGSYGGVASIAFGYVQGMANYALPVIAIGARGQFPSRISQPGRNRRRRKRAARKKA